jgi:hypothetical protein
MADSHSPPLLPGHIVIPDINQTIKSVMHAQLRNLIISRRTLYEWGNVLILEEQGENRRSLRIIPDEIYLKPKFVGKMIALNKLVKEKRLLIEQGEIERANAISDEVDAQLKELAKTEDN